MDMMTLAQDDPATWDPALDGVIAAPENHTVLYEDDTIRVLAVHIEPGAREKLHHHAVPSVMVIDRLVALRDFDAAGNEVALPIPDVIELPLVLKLPPQAAHSVWNVDTKPFHATRIEFKQGYPVG